ncbi:MAG: putative metal-binding motif-containing protein [Myxococcota bacterium]
MAVVGCGGDPDRDRDGDGWSVAAGDCDDRDPDRFPGAPDSPEDGLDSDCDGADRGSDALLGDFAAAVGAPRDDFQRLGLRLVAGDVDGDGVAGGDRGFAGPGERQLAARPGGGVGG